jgi:hypothetical protein
VPGHIEELSFTPGFHNIIVYWKKPILNTHCVTGYIIEWIDIQNGNDAETIVSWEKDSYVIEDLEACVDYEVSVRAMNQYNQITDAVTGKTKTETKGIYESQFI